MHGLFAQLHTVAGRGSLHAGKAVLPQGARLAFRPVFRRRDRKASAKRLDPFDCFLYKTAELRCKRDRIAAVRCDRWRPPGSVSGTFLPDTWPARTAEPHIPVLRGVFRACTQPDTA